MTYDLKFDETRYTVETAECNGIRMVYRAFENIVYAANPSDIEHQRLSIFVPEAYYEKMGSTKYELKSAPIFFPNGVGGYMPGEILKPGTNFKGEMNASLYALTRGFVVVSAAARGRGLQGKDGAFIGMAPAGIVDLKAAIRYLRENQDTIPGNVERIFSNGTSAGGALSSLLGASGNHKDFEKALDKIGAAKQRDDIFAASCYCPITNLEHADMAYEWEFEGLHTAHQMQFRPPVSGDGKQSRVPVELAMTPEQIELSVMEKAMFPSYLNGLELRDIDGTKLELNADGTGSFQNYVEKYVIASAQKELEKGTDLSVFDWLTVQNGMVTAIDFKKYVAFRTRMKVTPAFDSITLGTPENELFGSADEKYRHFTAFSAKHSSVGDNLADEFQIKQMNPMNYISDDSCTTAKHYRIRHGLVDRDTSLAISAILTAELRNCGVEVDYHLPWGIPHAGDYDLEELFDWMEDMIK